MVGRRLSALNKLRAEIDSLYDISAEVVEADQCDGAGRRLIASKVRELQPVAAILAAGITSVGPFDADKSAEYRHLLETNVIGFTELLASIAGIFKERGTPAGILAISSLGGETSVPYQAVYGASKAYVNGLVQALSVELAGTGVSIGAFLPGGIDTQMAAQSSLRFGKMGLMDVDRCAALAVRSLIRQHQFSIPGIGNRLTYHASRILPRSMVGRIAALPYRR